MRIDTLAHVKNQFSTVIGKLGNEPLFITRNGKVAAVIQSVSDDEVEDYLFRNSRKFWRLMESRRGQAEDGRTLPFDPARYQNDDTGPRSKMAVKEKRAKYKAKSKGRKQGSSGGA